MPKSMEELHEIKEEIKTLNRKLKELSDEELKQVTGGSRMILICSRKIEDENGYATNEMKGRIIGREGRNN